MKKRVWYVKNKNYKKIRKMDYIFLSNLMLRIFNWEKSKIEKFCGWNFYTNITFIDLTKKGLFIINE